MSDEDFGELDNDDLMDLNEMQKQQPPANQKQPQKPVQKKWQQNQEDDVEFIDEDLDNLPNKQITAKKPSEKFTSYKSPPIQQQQLQKNNDQFDDDDDYQAISVEESKIVKQSQPKKEEDDDDDFRFQDDESENQNQSKQNPQKNKIKNDEYNEYKNLTKQQSNQQVTYQQQNQDDENLYDDEQLSQKDNQSQEGNYYDYDYEEEEEKQQKQQKQQSNSKKQNQMDDEEQYDEDFDNQQDEEDEFQENSQSKMADDYNQDSKQDETYLHDDQVKNSHSKQTKPISKPPLSQKIYLPQPYSEKYANILIEVDYTDWTDKQLLKENHILRTKLKELSEEVTKLIEKAKLRPQISEKKDISVENKIKILREDLKNNNKRLEQQKKEIESLKERIAAVSSPKYYSELQDEIKKLTKEIDQQRKKNKQDQIEQDKKGKNLDKIENIMGIPESLQERQKKAVELDMIDRKNQQLQEQIKKLEKEIEDNKQKLPKVQNELDEKLKQAIQLKIDVDPDQPLTKLRDKYLELDRKKTNLQKHLEMLKSNQGKVSVAMREIEELKKQIKQKNEDINGLEMQIMQQKKQIEESKQKIPEKQYLKMQQASQTQQYYKVGDTQNGPNENNQDGKVMRKLMSAKPEIQPKNAIPQQQQSKQKSKSKEKHPEMNQPDSPKFKQEQSNNPSKQFQNDNKKDLKSQQKEEKKEDKKDEQKDLHQPHQQQGNQKDHSPQQNTNLNAPQQQEQQVIQPSIYSKPSKPFALKKNAQTVNPNIDYSQQAIQQPQQQQQIDNNKFTFGQLNQQELKLHNDQDQAPVVQKKMIKFNNPNNPQSEEPKLNLGDNNSQTKQQDLQPNQDDEYKPTRRNRLKQAQTTANNNEDSYSYDPTSRNNQQKIHEEEKTSKQHDELNYLGPKANDRQQQPIQMGISQNHSKTSNEQQQEESYQFASRRNRGALNKEENKEDYLFKNNDTKSQEYKLEPGKVEFKLDSQKEQSQQPQSFNFNRNRTILEEKKQEEKPVEEPPKPAQQKQQAQRARGGPRKLDIWAEEETSNQKQQPDVYNIKSLDEPAQPVQQPKKEERRIRQVEEDREMTLDEILGGGAKNADQEFKPKRNFKIPEDDEDQPKKPVDQSGFGKKKTVNQKSESERQRELARKAEQNNLFDDMDI